MAHHKSAIKRIRTAEKARLYNRRYRIKMRNAVKNLLSQQNKEEALPLLKDTVSILDKLAQRGIIHKNKAANQKSRLTKFVNNLS